MLNSLISEQIIRPLLPLGQKNRRYANRIIRLAYLLFLILMMIVEFSGWTYTFEIWPLSSLIYRLGQILLAPPFFILGFPPITNVEFICGLIFVIDVLTNGIYFKKLAIVVLGALLSCALNTLAFNDRFIFFLCLIAAYPSTLSLRRTIIVYLITGTSLTLLTTCLALCGVISTVVSFEHGVLRHSLGFTYTNGLAVTATSLVMAWVYLKSSTWRWQDACFSVAILLIILTICDGRSACAFALIQVIVTSILNIKYIRPRFHKAFSQLFYMSAIFLFPLLATFSLISLPILGKIDGTTLFTAFDSLLSGRLGIWINDFAQFGYPLISKPFETLTYSDNSFLHIVWTCGIVALVFFALLYVITGRWTKGRQDLPLAIYLTIFILHCFTEVLIYEFTMGFIILPIGAALASMRIASSPPREDKTEKKAYAHG